jgi:hypothetical protein
LNVEGRLRIERGEVAEYDGTIPLTMAYAGTGSPHQAIGHFEQVGGGNLRHTAGRLRLRACSKQGNSPPLYRVTGGLIRNGWCGPLAE